ncbi:MAG: Ig-like domain-containing protein, partial [Acidimicrobiia bacterium]|nr:Ig-like domain-containing protein [Acidimicrobiia bacterium]
TADIVTVDPVDTSVLGSYTVTYNVTDSSGNSATQVFRLVQVTGDAVPPVITILGDNPQTIPAGTPYVELGATATDSIDGDLTGSIVIDASAVNTGVAGTYSVSYSVADSSGNPATVFRTVSVVVVNLPPVVINPGVQTTEAGLDVALQIAASDPDDDGLTYVAAGLPPGLSISSTGLISGVVPLESAGTYPVTVTATDDGVPNLSGQANFVWIVTDNNQAPLAINDQYTVDEGDTLVVGAPGVLGNDTDPDDQPLTAVLVTPPTQGTVILASDGSFTYTHTAGNAIDDSFTYVATDSRGGTGLAVVIIRVLENLAPVVVGDLLAIDEDTVGSIDVLANDLDPEGAPLAIVGIEQPANGVATLKADGTLSFTPAPDWFGATGFVYLATDGRKSSRGLVTVRVAAVNDLPVGVPDAYRFTRYGPAALNVLSNDSDVDGDVLSVIAVGSVEHALAEILDGELVYNAHSEWLGSESFTYTLSDGNGGLVEVPVTVTMAEEALAAANDLAEEIGAPDVPFDGPAASPFLPSISLVSPKGISLLAGAFFDSFDALRLPLVFLLMALVWALIFGGLFSSPWFVFGSRRRFWSIVLVDRESMVGVYAEPDFGSTTVYNYPPTTQSIRSNGAPKRKGKTVWMPVYTPNGEGWIDAYYLTQEVDDKTFAGDKRPADLAAKFVRALTAGDARAMQKLVAKRGLASIRFGKPVVVPVHRLKALLSAEKEPGWWRSDALTAMEALFPERVAEPFLSSYWSGRQPEGSGKVATLLVPAEIRNFHRYTYSSADGTWWLAFEYRKNNLSIAGVALAE